VTVSKVLDILEFLGQQNRTFGLRELSKLLHIPKATLFRYLVTLEERGYVTKTPEKGEYALGLKILELSTGMLRRMTLHELALPYMRELQERSQQTVNLGVLEGNEVVYIEILESPQTFKMSARVGGRDFPHSTSIGKSILAFLPKEQVEQIAKATGLPKRTEKTISLLPQLVEELKAIRQQGYAIENGENEEGALCIGAPILNHLGNAIAAISISGPASHFSQELVKKLSPDLVEATSQISQRIGYLDKV